MKRQENMPELVYWGLWGINSRATALAYLWFCVIAAIGSMFYGFFNAWAFLGMFMLVAAAWYRHAINWADQNSAWKNE